MRTTFLLIFALSAASLWAQDDEKVDAMRQYLLTRIQSCQEHCTRVQTLLDSGLASNEELSRVLCERERWTYQFELFDSFGMVEDHPALVSLRLQYGLPACSLEWGERREELARRNLSYLRTQLDAAQLRLEHASKLRKESVASDQAVYEAQNSIEGLELLVRLEEITLEAAAE